MEFGKREKRIEVYDPSGETARILRQILRLCGRFCYQVCGAGESWDSGEAAVVLICGPEGIGFSDRGTVCVADYAWADRLPAGRLVLTYSLEQDRADFTARNIRKWENGIAFEIVGIGIIGRVRLKTDRTGIQGKALAAAAAAIGSGIPFADVMSALGEIDF